MTCNKTLMYMILPLGVLAVASAAAASFAEMCAQGAGFTDLVGVRLTLLAGQLEAYQGALRLVSAGLLVPAFLLAYRPGERPSGEGPPVRSAWAVAGAWVAFAGALAVSLLPGFLR